MTKQEENILERIIQAAVDLAELRAENKLLREQNENLTKMLLSLNKENGTNN